MSDVSFGKLVRSSDLRQTKGCFSMAASICCTPWTGIPVGSIMSTFVPVLAHVKLENSAPGMPIIPSGL